MTKIIIILVCVIIILCFICYFMKVCKKETYIPMPNDFLEKNNLPDKLNFNQFKNYLKENYKQDADSMDYIKYMRLKS